MKTKGVLIEAALVLSLVAILFASSPIEAQQTPSPGPDVVGLWHMNENEGSLIRDETDNHHDGETSGTSWVPGKFGGALGFDGGAYVDLGDDSSLNSLRDFTLEAWIKPAEESLSGRTAGFANIINKYGTNQFDLQLWHGHLFGAYGLGYWYHTKSSVTLEADVWTYVAFSFQYSDKTRKLYINGVEVDTVEGTGLTGPGTDKTLYFGRGFNFPTGQEYVGALDEVQITAKVLTSDEIMDHFESGSEH